MKRRLILLGTALVLGAVLTGCRRDMPPMVTTETVPPLATVPTTRPREETTFLPRPEPEVPTVTAQDQALPENTIEDGNGPIPAQPTPKEF